MDYSIVCKQRLLKGVMENVKDFKCKKDIVYNLGMQSTDVILGGRGEEFNAVMQRVLFF